MRKTKYFLLMLTMLLVHLSYGQEMTAQEEKKMAQQKAADDKILREYFTKYHISPQKNGVGVYCVIAKEGSGKKIMAGQTVSLNYTGRLLDGTVFDSNTDPAFHHTQPLVFEVGKGSMIRGYDKGVQMLKKGSIATLYMPSTLGYGEAGRPSIPPNSILIFEVEVLNVTKE